MTIAIIGGIVAAIIILGAYLRWAVQPVLVGYRCGRVIGRMAGAKLARRAAL